MSGTLALVGGGEWTDRCREIDVQLLEASGGAEVVVLPTAAAYEQPHLAVETATAWFSALGAAVRPVMALARPDASDPALVEAVAGARFLYLGGGSPLHLRSVLKDSPLWEAIAHAWDNGAVLAGSSAGAMVLCDPMVDPRGGALTVGLGLVEQVAIIPHADTWSVDKTNRTFDLATGGLAVVAIDTHTALIRDPDGSWRAAGAGRVAVWRDGTDASLASLPG
ncbi:MAG: Type 1 glutamine amidotransferase-like domain-containing protein [Acidimicrobiales bacterium]